MPRQAELAERLERENWARLVAAGAAEMGVDIRTYATLVMLQHRDITPEDYDVLQTLDEKHGLVGGVAPTTLTQETVERLLPVWVVPPSKEAGVDSVSPPKDGDFHGAEGQEALRGSPCCGHAKVGLAEQPEAGIMMPPTGAFELSGSECTICGIAPPEHELRDKQCSVCLEPFEAGQTARTLPCKHHFHALCIDQWLTSRSRNCPVDAQPVVAVDEASHAG
jgi:hypothetical protein